MSCLFQNTDSGGSLTSPTSPSSVCFSDHPSLWNALHWKLAIQVSGISGGAGRGRMPQGTRWEGQQNCPSCPWLHPPLLLCSGGCPSSPLLFVFFLSGGEHPPESLLRAREVMHGLPGPQKVLIPVFRMPWGGETVNSITRWATAPWRCAPGYHPPPPGMPLVQVFV